MEELLEALGISGPDALGGAAALGLLTSAYNRLGGIGERGQELGAQLAETQMGQAAFRPYTVTTATGGQFGTQIDPVTGQLRTTMGVSPEEQAMRSQLFGGAGQFYEQAAMPTGERE